jgi:enoyl-CoA hydratase/carnithine racemase
VSYQDLLYGVEDQVATITLNRPERMNALSRNLESEIHRAFDEADADRSVRAIILTGNGAAFSAGYDQAATAPSGVSHADP